MTLSDLCLALHKPEILEDMYQYNIPSQMNSELQHIKVTRGLDIQHEDQVPAWIPLFPMS